MGDDRPSVSVVVPFLGSPEDASALRRALDELETRPGDELIVADNTASGVFARSADGDRIAVVPAAGERSSYRSRNVGAADASNEWLLFFDSDCRPRPDLIDRYFDITIPDNVGSVAGAVLPLRRKENLMARYAASRGVNMQAAPLRDSYKPFAVTANLLVRTAAWRAVGGFQEGIRSGGDADFCWRIQDAGWSMSYRDEASVRHLLRENLRDYLRVHARYGAGLRWLQVRHPAALIGPNPRRAVRRLAGAVVWPLTGQFERGLFKAVDVLVILAESAGYLMGNSAPRSPGEAPAPERRRIALMADRFPEPSETFVVNEAKALDDLGFQVQVEARSRPERPGLGAARALKVSYQEDSAIARKAVALAWLAARHPLRCAADFSARRRWRREEDVVPLRVLAPLARRLSRDRVDHLHVHFVRRAALDALRINGLLGIPYSVTAHAWDIFVQRKNLAEKIERSAFTTTGCEYNVRHLRSMVDPEAAGKIHKIVMGVDPARFHRSASYDGGGSVIAIGRLVEKKGFEHLLDAAARLRDFDGLDRVVIVGDGPLRERLDEQRRHLGLERVVRFVGTKRPDEVRQLIEESALLTMPAVVASDGDRDSMPVVVKEALAMEVPVVASDEVGLPEVVRDEWGRLVPPGDAESLAGAIKELLTLPAEERARMGRSGREFVRREYSLADQTARLAELIEAD